MLHAHCHCTIMSCNLPTTVIILFIPSSIVLPCFSSLLRVYPSLLVTRDFSHVIANWKRLTTSDAGTMKPVLRWLCRYLTLCDFIAVDWFTRFHCPLIHTILVLIFKGDCHFPSQSCLHSTDVTCAACFHTPIYKRQSCICAACFVIFPVFLCSNSLFWKPVQFRLFHSPSESELIPHCSKEIVPIVNVYYYSPVTFPTKHNVVRAWTKISENYVPSSTYCKTLKFCAPTMTAAFATVSFNQFETFHIVWYTSQNLCMLFNFVKYLIGKI